MGKKASSSADYPDEWEPVDYPEPTSSAPNIFRWRQLCRLMLLRIWLRGHWNEMGEYLKRLKARRMSASPQMNLPEGPDEPPPDSGASRSLLKGGRKKK